MTPVPRPSAEDNTTVLGLVAGQLSKLQDSVSTGFRDLSADISRLRDESVARREFDRFRDELRVDWSEAVAMRDREIAEIRTTCVKGVTDLQAAHEKSEARAVANRRWVIGSTIAAGSALAAGVAALADLLSHLGH